MIAFLSSLNWIDAFFCAVCVLFLLTGAQKGLIKTIANTSMVLVGLAIAVVGAGRLTPVLSASMGPLVAETIRARLGGEAVLSEALSQQAAEAILGALESTLIHIVVFTILFLLIMLIWTLACSNLNFYKTMPAVKGFDQLFGGVCGALLGMILALIILYIGNHFGFVSTKNIESSFFVGRLLRIFPFLL